MPDPSQESPESRPPSGGLTPPSPRGSLRQLVRDPLAYYLSLAREYGDLVCYRPAPEPAYLVNHPDYIKHVLVDNNRNYTKDTYINQMFKAQVGDGLLTSEGDAWRRQRRLMQPAFHQQRTFKLDTVITGAASRMLDRWEVRRAAGHTLDIAAEMATLTLSITTRALFGVDIGEEVNAVGEAVNVGADLLEKSPRHPRFQTGMQTVERVVDRIIAERRRPGGGSEDLLATLMQARDEETGTGMDDRQLRSQVMTLLLAGYETTASALAWTWFLVAQHPAVLEKLRREAQQVVGDRLPASADLQDLAYTRMVFEEAMRLYPPAWILGRRALGEDKIDGYSVPANTILAVSPYLMHRHPGFWTDPEAFDPERFTPERSAGRHRFAYIPFGAGPRLCIGNNFAMIEAQLIIALVACRYRLRLEPGQEIKPEPIFILRPNGPILMTLES